MKKTLLVLRCALATLAGGTAAFAAPATNLGFETGNLNGWSGVGTVITSMAPDYPSAASGMFMLRNDGTCFSNAVSQKVTLKKDRLVSGLAAFAAADELPYDDHAEVFIADSTGLLTTVCSKAVHDVGDFGHSPFEPWVFTAPADGEYTISYSSANALDCMFASTLLGDSVTAVLTCSPVIPNLSVACTLKTDSGVPLAGKVLHFEAGGPLASSATATTDAGGVAAISAIGNAPEGTLFVAAAVVNGGYTAEFYGDTDANGSTGSGSAQ